MFSYPSAKPTTLIGMMGSGKSTLGKLLAKRCELPFVDSDEIIVQTDGRSIPEIFAEEGEAFFRGLEHDCLKNIFDERKGEPFILSTGGGAFTQEANRDLLKTRSHTVYLRAPVNVLMKRVGEGKGRPLLEGLSKEERREKLSAILQQRAADYEQAQFIVDMAATDKARDTAQRILKQLAAHPHI